MICWMECAVTEEVGSEEQHRWLPLVGLAALVGIYLAQAGYYWHYINDDAYITYRYSRFLAAGHGPFFNIGEHVEGYTNFLLMSLLAAAMKILGWACAPVVSKTIGVVSGALCVVFSFLLTRLLAGRLPRLDTHAAYWGLAAAGIVAVAPAFAFNSTSGLETSFFAMFITLGALLGTKEIDRQRWYGSGIALACAALTRPEGAVLFTAFWIAQALTWLLASRPSREAGGSLFRRLWNDPMVRALLLNGVIFTAVFLAQMAFRLVTYDGEWLPNTYYAKKELIADEWEQVGNGMLALFVGLPGIALAVAGYLLHIRRLRPIIPIIVLGVMGTCLPFLTNGDWMIGYRLLMPYLPVMAVVVILGWALIAGRVLRNGLRFALLAAVLYTPLLWKRQTHNRNKFYTTSVARVQGYATGHGALADWVLAGGVPAGGTIAVMDIGMIAYRCVDHRILDISGLTDRFIAMSPGGFLKKKYDPAYVFDKKPEVVVIVFSTPGVSYTPLDADTEFRFWTPTEEWLYASDAFQKDYIQHNDSREPGPLTAFADRIGAERIFEHGFPGSRYLLAVFRRANRE